MNMAGSAAGVASALISVLVGTAGSAPAFEQVSVRGEELIAGGRPYRAIGVNHPPLFSAWLTEADAGLTNSFSALDDAATSGVAFVRFWASGFWPRDMRAYFERPTAYWAAMDAVVERAERLGVRLLPSLFWMSFLWPDLCDEPRGAIAVAGSKTRVAMERYVRELVGRYRGRPVILMWEIGNEYNLEADLDFTSRPRAMGAGAPHLGTRPVRGPQDNLTTAMLSVFLAEMAALVRELDPGRPVTSGHSHPRAQSRALRESYPRPNWTADTLGEHLASFALQHPAPLDVWSVHFYGALAPPARPAEPRIEGRHPQSIDMLAEYARAARRAGRPLLVGELGLATEAGGAEDRRRFVLAAVDALEREGADLIALWVWHFPQQAHYNLTGRDDPELLATVREFNRRYGSAPAGAIR
ncbi:MAG: DUF4038 domain-containing protein [Kiritimatiellae bacterium]|nr:DUF4038 domain-containing protein [Kiritimatiellia bacterium]